MIRNRSSEERKDPPGASVVLLNNDHRQGTIYKKSQPLPPPQPAASNQYEKGKQSSKGAHGVMRRMTRFVSSYKHNIIISIFISGIVISCYMFSGRSSSSEFSLSPFGYPIDVSNTQTAAAVHNNGYRKQAKKKSSQERPHQQPKQKQKQKYLSKDGPPDGIVVRGSRDYYAPCPPKYKKRVWIDLVEDQNIHRAFRYNGWYVGGGKEGFTSGEYQVLWRKMGKHEQQFTQGIPWQRYSRIPGFSFLESKDGFAAGFRKYQRDKDPENKEDLIYFIPETYRLVLAADREAFTKAIQHDKTTGRHRPWVLKKTKLNNGKGVEILPPNSPALYDAVQRSRDDTKHRYIVQAYICNELTWFGGEKFDLRFFWFVASVDPLIVLYQDGYVRVGGAMYNETDFESTGQHLTNHAFRTDMDENVTANDLWRRVREHYAANKERLSKIIVGDDPVQHVRNQLKEAIGSTGAAFRDVLSLNGPNKVNVTNENLFGFYGADFILDADLDVFYVEAQASPGMGQKQDFRIDVFRRLFRPVVKMIEEITEKQASDASANLWPLENMGDWEIAYVGDWRYKYEGYKRSKNKAGCALPASTSVG